MDTKDIEKAKTSFIKKHLGKIFFLIISAIITLAVSKIFTDSPSKELTVYDNGNISFIDNYNIDSPSKTHIKVMLFEKGNIAKKKLRSLFFKTISIKNTGNKGADNILVSICLEGDNIFLVDTPTIKTVPQEIISGLKVHKNASSTKNKHIWNISLLNPMESIVFDYTIYSELGVKDFKINVLPRKKDWKVRNISVLNHRKKELQKYLGLLTFVCFIAGALTMYLCRPSPVNNNK